MAEERRSCVCSQFEQRAGSLLFLYDLSLVSSSTPVTVMAIHRLLTFKSLFPAWFSFLSSRFTHLTVHWTSLQRSSTVSSYITGSKLNLTISTLTSPAPPPPSPLVPSSQSLAHSISLPCWHAYIYPVHKSCFYLFIFEPICLSLCPLSLSYVLSPCLHSFLHTSKREKFF